MSAASGTEFSRRKFLRAAGLGGTAFCIGLYFPATAQLEKIIKFAEADQSDIELCAWILINPSGKVTLVSHRAEMGQGVYHSLAQIIAEELEVDLNDVDIIFGPGNRKKYGNQITGGSSTIRGSYKNLLKLSATARDMLIEAAAKKWNVSVTDCYAQAGHVYHKGTGRKFHYGELVLTASQLESPKNVTLKNRSDYKMIGKGMHRQDTPLKTNGTAIFGLDIKIPGMLYAVVERNPRLRGKVKNYDDSAARRVPGVQRIFPVRMGVFDTYREGVAVIADTLWAAMEGKKALNVEWDDSGFEHLSTEEIYRRMREDLETKEGISFRKQGDVEAILAQAEKKIDVVYETPYQYHACMEPLNCLAHWQEDKLEVWGPIQAPEWVQDFISKEMKIPVDKIIVNMTFLGGGFGRKAFMDYPHEAALISREMNAPVKVVWTREDDATQGPYRPGISYRCQGAVSGEEINAYKVKLSGQNVSHWRGGKKDQANGSASEGLLKPYFQSIKNLSIQDVPFETPIPIMWWRSVYASTNGFAYESFTDELAHAAGKDPLEFRRKHLQDERCQRLIDKLEEVSGWKSRKKNGGFGVAITECFGTTVGQIVKVSRDVDNGIKVDHVWAVMDCGWYVNPDIIKAQVEGSIIMALGAATMHEVIFKDGVAVAKNFYDYKLPRIHEVPTIEVHIMENTADAGGVGEPGLPPFAPALTNAIFDLTGKRIRKLPFSLASV